VPDSNYRRQEYGALRLCGGIYGGLNCGGIAFGAITGAPKSRGLNEPLPGRSRPREPAAEPTPQRRQKRRTTQGKALRQVALYLELQGMLFGRAWVLPVLLGCHYLDRSGSSAEDLILDQTPLGTPAAASSGRLSACDQPIAGEHAFVGRPACIAVSPQVLRKLEHAAACARRRRGPRFFQVRAASSAAGELGAIIQMNASALQLLTK